MRILHVITSLRTGGAEHLMVSLLPHLRNMGNEVELLLFDGTRTPFYEQLEATGIAIHHLTIGGNVYNPLNIIRMSKFMRKFDIVHTHNTACQLFAPVANLLSGSHAKLVTTEHSANNRRRSKAYLKWADRWMYKRYQFIICISEQPATNLKQHIGNLDCIITIHNGVDIAKYLGPIKDISQNDSFLITQVSSFNVAKDQDTVIHALVLLPDNYRLQLVGDGERRKTVETLALEMGLRDRVDFLGIRTDIPELLHKSDIVVLSSHWEGLSLSSIEGMASGRPFIASDVDGLHEVVEGAGILFPHGDAMALAQAVQQLCENPYHYSNIASCCQKRAKEFDISLMSERYNNLYQKIL